MNANAVYIWVGCIVLISSALLAYSSMKMQTGQIRRWFMLMIVLCLSYMLPLICFYHPDMGAEVRIWLARTVFMFAPLMILAAFVFITHFCAREAILKRIYIKALLITTVAVSLVNLSNFTVKTVSGLNLIYGPGQLATVILLGVMFILILGVGISAYRETNDRLFQYQLKVVLISGLSALGISIITNGLIPFVYKTSIFAPMAAVSLLSIMGIWMHLIVQGEAVFLIRNFKRMIKAPGFQIEGNYFAMNSLLYGINEFFAEKRIKETRNIRFRNNEEAIELRIGQDGIKPEAESGIMVNILKGELLKIPALEFSVIRLGLALEQARDFISEQNKTINSIEEFVKDAAVSRFISMRKKMTELIQEYRQSDEYASINEMLLPEAARTSDEHDREKDFDVLRVCSRNLGPFSIVEETDALNVLDIEALEELVLFGKLVPIGKQKYVIADEAMERAGELADILQKFSPEEIINALSDTTE